MDDEWSISQPFEDANEEDAQLQFHDLPGQTHREDLIGWEAENRSGVKGRLVEVVHGYKGDKSRPRTLIVFEWRLVPGAGADRIKNVKIIAAFQATGTRFGVPKGGSIADWDPVPIQWVPDKTILGHFAQASVTEDESTELSGKAGYAEYIGVKGKRKTGSTLKVERVDYRYITGGPAYIGKNAGTRNGMKWELSENAALKSGVQYEVRTAVLLRRKPYDFGKFNVTVVAEANQSRPGHVVGKLLRALRILPTDGPAAFDPMVLPGSSKGEAGDDDVAARATHRDWENLDNLNLNDVWIEDWGVASAEDLPKTGATSTEGKDETAPSTEDTK
jgi:hypothetical protein